MKILYAAEAVVEGGREGHGRTSDGRLEVDFTGPAKLGRHRDGTIQHSLEIEGKGLKSEGDQVGEAKLKQALNPGQSGVLTVSFQKPGTCVMYWPDRRPRTVGYEGRGGGQVAGMASRLLLEVSEGELAEAAGLGCTR
jgi:hypothetical protein